MNALNGSEKVFLLMETAGREADLETDSTRDGENREEEKQVGFVLSTGTKQGELAVNPRVAVCSAHAQQSVTTPLPPMTDGPPGRRPLKSTAKINKLKRALAHTPTTP